MAAQTHFVCKSGTKDPWESKTSEILFQVRLRLVERTHDKPAERGALRRQTERLAHGVRVDEETTLSGLPVLLLVRGRFQPASDSEKLVSLEPERCRRRSLNYGNSLGPLTLRA